MRRYLLIGFLILWLGVACGDQSDSTVVAQPTETANAPITNDNEVPTLPAPTRNSTYITVATSPPLSPFFSINEFGQVVGVEADMMKRIAEQANLDVEFVVTEFDGLLNSVALGEFDAGMFQLLVDQLYTGTTFTVPYLTIEQVLMVRANETELVTIDSLLPDTRLGVTKNSRAYYAATHNLPFTPNNLLLFNEQSQTVQALIDGQVDAIVLDAEDAQYHAQEHFQQLKIVGEGGGQKLSQVSYGIAVADTNPVLLEALNVAITELQTNGGLAQIVEDQLVDRTSIQAGDSLVGTPSNEFVIGVVGDVNEFSLLQAFPDLISWEISRNTMSSLYRLNGNSELVPFLITDLFVSDDGLIYNVNLRDDLVFPNGQPLQAEDVRRSIMRSVGFGNWRVNDFLKNDDQDEGDIFANTDAVQVLSPLSLRIELQEPTSYFPSLLATPPYHVLSPECFEDETRCMGLGAYVIDSMDEQSIRLKANPQWRNLADAPQMENVQIRFYDTSTALREALERGSIDMAWTGLSTSDLLLLQNNPDYNVVVGDAYAKSSLVFVHDKEPWNDARVRRAAGFAIDREAIAQTVFAGTRQALYSPIPNSVTGFVESFPHRDLAQARTLLNAAGYSEARPLEITIWYVSDGRYSNVEELYAQAIETQLEETNIFQVTLVGEPWSTFGSQKTLCNYDAFLQGWPTPGQTVSYDDPMSWLYFFIENPTRVCSNYESTAMERLLVELEETNPKVIEERMAFYEQLQALWAEEVPALPLTQSPRIAVTANYVTQVTIDSMGMLHYDQLDKEQ